MALKNTDYKFKSFFTPQCESLRTAQFLNFVLELEESDRIDDVNVVDPNMLPEQMGLKGCIPDVLVVDKKGNKYILEMQNRKDRCYSQRVSYYAARAYSSGLFAGQTYCDLQKVHVVAILGYNLFPKKESYKWTHRILNVASAVNEI